MYIGVSRKPYFLAKKRLGLSLLDSVKESREAVGEAWESR